MYESLNHSNGTSTSSVDVNEVTRYAINVASAFSTKSFGIGREHNHVTLEYQTSNLSGSGVLKLQHSRDGLVWYDLINSLGTTAQITVSDSSGYFVVDNYPLGRFRAVWTPNSTPSGTITLLLEL